MIDKEFNRDLNMQIGKFNVPNPKSYMYYKDLNKQLEQEVGDFLHKNTNAPQLYSNDLRHQYASALYARNLGAENAKTLGDLHEKYNFYYNGNIDGAKDSQIDTLNNEIGRNYGLKYPNIPKEDLLYKLLTDWKVNKAEVENRLK